MNERHIKLDHLLILAESPCSPDQYQARQNELARATARTLIEEHQEKIEETDDFFYETSSDINKREVLHSLGELLTHPLFKILDLQLSTSNFESELAGIMLDVKDVKTRLAKVWNIVNTGNPEGRW